MATFKDYVRVATTANITLSGTQTIDEVAVITGPPPDRVLVKNQTNAAENGIYVVASGAWSRADDADASAEMTPETTVRVWQGTANAHTEWTLATQAPITLGITALTFQIQPVVADDLARSASGRPIDRVVGVHGRPIASTTPLNGHAYVYDSTANEHRPIPVQPGGKIEVNVKTADQSLTAEQARKGSIRATGHAFARRTLTIAPPASATEAMIRTIHNGMSQDAPIFDPNEIYQVGDVVRRTSSPSRWGIAFEVTTASAAATTEPAQFGTATVGQSFTHSGVTWIVRDTTKVPYLIVQTNTSSRRVSIPPGASAILEIDENGVREIIGGFYDPRNFGAKVDNQTDDLPAFQAMHDAMPHVGGRVMLSNGISWLSNTWRISKPIEVYGSGGSPFIVGDEKNEGAAVQVPPGRTAIQCDGVLLSTDGNDAARYHLHHFGLKSHGLFHGYAHGTTAGTGVMLGWENGAKARLGDVFIALAFGSPTRCFRVESISGTGYDGVSAATLTNNTVFNPGGTQPAWNTALNQTTQQTSVEGWTITWRTEAIPQAHAAGSTYSQYDRVYMPNDNRYYLECEGGGPSETTRGRLLGGGPDGSGNGTLPWGLSVGQTIVDYQVTWRVKLAAGIYGAATMGMIQCVSICGFTNAAVHIQGGAGQDVAAAKTDVNCTRVRDVYCDYCGLGVYVAGGDANGVVLDAFFGINLGQYQPTADAAFANKLGGHLIADNSLGGVIATSCYAQRCARPVMKFGLGRSTYVGCYDEGDLRSLCTAGAAYVMGGSVSFDRASPGVAVELSETGWGLKETIQHLGTPLWQPNTPYVKGAIVSPNPRRFNGGGIAFQAQNDGTTGGTQPDEFHGNPTANPPIPALSPGQTCSDGGVGGVGAVVWLCVIDDVRIGLTLQDSTHSVLNMYGGPGPNWIRYQYASGYWRRRHGNQITRDAYWLAATQSGLGGPGPGTFGFVDGYFLGDPVLDTMIFDGKKSAINDRELRYGIRNKGDRFRTGDTTIVLTSDGFRGTRFQDYPDTTTLQPADPLSKRVAMLVEPSSNTARRSGGEQVWETIAPGVRGTEPAWPASPTQGVTTIQTDGGSGATLRFLGFTPSYSVEQGNVAKLSPALRAIRVELTSTTTDQVVDDGGVRDGVDLALPDNSTTTITWTVNAKRKGTNQGGLIRIEATYVRHNGGAPTLLGTESPAGSGANSVAYNLAGANIDGTTVTVTVSGNRVCLCCTPESADATNVFSLAIQRVQTECVQ